VDDIESRLKNSRAFRKVIVFLLAWGATTFVLAVTTLTYLALKELIG
jgi:hypothetical protein